MEDISDILTFDVKDGLNESNAELFGNKTFSSVIFDSTRNNSRIITRNNSRINLQRLELDLPE